VPQETEQHVSGRVAAGFDHHSAEYAQDWVGYVKDLAPISRADTYDGFWIASGYDAVVEVGRDPSRFSTGPYPGGASALSVPPASRAPYPLSPLDREGTEFTEVRRFLDTLFTRSAVAKLDAGIQYYADYFLDQVIEEGRMELMSAFAAPVPATISVDWYGLSPDTWQFYAKRFGEQQRTKPGTPEFEAAMRGLVEVNQEIGRETIARRENPRDDALSKIANAMLGGKEISEAMAIGTAAFVLSGGVNTTAILTAHSLVYLSEHREDHDRLREDDRFLKTAIEEMLRLTTPVLSTARALACPVRLDDQELPAGGPILVHWAAANRDPAVFADPDEADLARWPNKHVAFGVGPHRCVGANLAKAMIKPMLRTILDRIPDFRVTGTEISPNRSIDNGFAHVAVEFSPGARVLPVGPPSPQFHMAQS
jgi:cytochrome P450